MAASGAMVGRATVVAFTTEDALDRADVVIDCTPSGSGLRHKEEQYLKRANPGRGRTAAGSPLRRMPCAAAPC